MIMFILVILLTSCSESSRDHRQGGVIDLAYYNPNEIPSISSENPYVLTTENPYPVTSTGESLSSNFNREFLSSNFNREFILSNLYTKSISCNTIRKLLSVLLDGEYYRKL